MKHFDWPITEKKFFDNAKSEWKLDVMFKALALLGNPHKVMEGKVIHIAGTNGKGSTASYVRTILEEAGCKVGCFTSPHLVEYNERFYFNGRLATDEEIEACKQEIIEKCGDKNGGNLKEISYFEASTLIAILLFARAGLDYYIFEVGLGGRLDATNIFQKPLACAITSISFDHVEFLGDTLEKIAYEKGGIIKEGCKVWTSNTKPEIVNVLQKIADEKNATLFCQGRDYDIDEKLKPSLFGEHQKSNATLASEVCKSIGIDRKFIEIGVSKTQWSGRLQKIEIIGLNASNDVMKNDVKNYVDNIDAIYLDGAHNEDGVKCLCEFVKQIKKKKKSDKWEGNICKKDGVNIIGVFACLKRKDYKSFFPMIATAGFDKMCFFDVPKDVNDFVEPSELVDLCQKYNLDGCGIGKFEEVKVFLKRGKKNIIFIFGSLYFVGFVMEKFVAGRHPA